MPIIPSNLRAEANKRIKGMYVLLAVLILFFSAALCLFIWKTSGLPPEAPTPSTAPKIYATVPTAPKEIQLQVQLRVEIQDSSGKLIPTASAIVAVNPRTLLAIQAKNQHISVQGDQVRRLWSHSKQQALPPDQQAAEEFVFHNVPREFKTAHYLFEIERLQLPKGYKAYSLEEQAKSSAKRPLFREEAESTGSKHKHKIKLTWIIPVEKE